jgi:hypothetical protein
MEEKPTSAFMQSLGLLGDSLEYFLPGMTRPSVFLVAFVLAAGGLVAFWIGIRIPGWRMKALAMVGLAAHSQAVVLLLSPGFALVHEAAAEFEARHWFIFLTLELVPASLLIGLAGLAVEM